jgi:DNA-binding transcriptional MerR regulator
MRIGELAATAGVSAKTIRYYEAIGLLPPPARTLAGYRTYGPADRERLHFIRTARDLGLTLAEIRAVLDLRDGGQPPCTHVRELLNHKIAAIDAQLRALTAWRRELVRLRDTAVAPGAPGAHCCPIIEGHRTGAGTGHRSAP